MSSSAEELAKKKAKLAELRKAKEARLASGPFSAVQVIKFQVSSKCMPQQIMVSQGVPSVEELLAAIPAALPTKQSQVEVDQPSSAKTSNTEDKSEVTAPIQRSSESRRALSYVDAVIFEIPGRHLEVIEGYFQDPTRNHAAYHIPRDLCTAVYFSTAPCHSTAPA